MMTRPVSIFVEASKKIYKFFDIHVFAYYIFLSIQCVLNKIFFKAKNSTWIDSHGCNHNDILIRFGQYSSGKFSFLYKLRFVPWILGEYHHDFGHRNQFKWSNCEHFFALKNIFFAIQIIIVKSLKKHKSVSYSLIMVNRQLLCSSFLCSQIRFTSHYKTLPFEVKKKNSGKRKQSTYIHKNKPQQETRGNDWQEDV